MWWEEAAACLELFFLRIILPRFSYIKLDVAMKGTIYFRISVKDSANLIWPVVVKSR